MTAIQKDFERFHRENSHVLLELEELAREWFDAGNKVVGVKMLFETLRWKSGIQTAGDPYKLNNNYHSRYVRMLIERNPHWVNRFKTRALRAA